MRDLLFDTRIFQLKIKPGISDRDRIITCNLHCLLSLPQILLRGVFLSPHLLQFQFAVALFICKIRQTTTFRPPTSGIGLFT